MSEINQTSSLDHEESRHIKNKAKSGLYLLLLRSSTLYFLRASSIYFMAKWLNPQDYGIFAIISNWAWAISYFLPDLCVEAALIQFNGKLSDDQMKNFFGLSFWRGIIILVFFLFFSKPSWPLSRSISDAYATSGGSIGASAAGALAERGVEVATGVPSA